MCIVIFIFNKNMLFFLWTKMNIGSHFFQTSPFWRYKIIGGNDHVIDIFNLYISLLLI